MSETPQSPALSGQMFLFQQPELINKEAHSGLGVNPPAKRFSFCASARAFPLTVSEIPSAMKDYPIVFLSMDQPVPVAITGLIDDVNLFVDENGEWESYRYIPGYVRRYPFGVALEQGGERFAVVIDRGYEGLVDGGALPLFENGEPTQNTQQAINFCQTYEEDRHRTVQFGEAIKELDLLSGQTAQFTPTGETEPRTFAEYIGINEDAVKNLSDEKLVELRNNGVLPIVYSMMMSLGNWRNILQRRAIRFQLSDANVLNPVLN